MSRRAVSTLLIVLSPFVAGFVGTVFTVDSIAGWYASLAKPFWTPPAFVFGPVWTTLYLLMGIAAALVYWRGREASRLPLKIFFAHLAVNALWSIVFFGLHQPLAAFVIIVALWLMIIALMVLFRRVSAIASWLLAPYLLWVTYASTLNLGIVLLN